MANLPLESTLADIFVKKAPKISEGGRKALTEWAPWIALVVGVLSLWSAWILWHWAHLANAAVNFANDLCHAYGGYAPSTCSAAANASRLSFWVWLGLIVLAIEGVLYLLAFSGLRDRKRSGWNLLYYGALVNVAYAVVSLFTDYSGVSHFLGAVIGSAVGFWVLFQVRDLYKPDVAPKAPIEK